ncbi:MAG: hypothetical protein WBV47_01220 [Salegentibacter sp.]
MKKSKKIPLYIFGGIAVLAVLLIAANNFAEYKIKKAIEKNFQQANISYEKINVSLLGRKAEAVKPQLKFENKKIDAALLSLDDIGVFNYLFGGKIVIGELKLKEPDLRMTGKKAQDSSAQSSKKVSDKKFNKEILIKELKVEKGRFAMSKKDSSVHKFFARVPLISFSEVKIDSSSLKKQIPFTYKNYEIRADSLFLNMNTEHDILVGDLKLEDGRMQVSDFRIVPRYSKSEFQKHIPYEKDRVELKIDSIGLADLQWHTENDSLELDNPMTTIGNAELKIYRDKRKPDDPRIKPMYSKMLRELPFKIKFDTLKLQNVYIRYEQMVKGERGPGMLDFRNLNASIYNLTNIGLQRKDFPITQVDVRADFMGEAPVVVDWNFNVSNPADYFTISGNMGELSGEGINNFMSPAMGVEAHGTIEDLQFNFSGNEEKATGETSLKYHDFKVKVLKDGGKKKSGLLSALANLIVDNKEMNEEQHHKDISVTRDKHKSFWNYFWLCLRAGALKSFLKF